QEPTLYGCWTHRFSVLINCKLKRMHLFDNIVRCFKEWRDLAPHREHCVRVMMAPGIDRFPMVHKGNRFCLEVEGACSSLEDLSIPAIGVIPQALSKTQRDIVVHQEPPTTTHLGESHVWQ